MENHAQLAVLAINLGANVNIPHSTSVVWLYTTNGCGEFHHSLRQNSQNNQRHYHLQTTFANITSINSSRLQLHEETIENCKNLQCLYSFSTHALYVGIGT